MFKFKKDAGEVTAAHFDTYDAPEAQGTVKTVTLTFRDGTVTTMEVADGLVLLGDTTENQMIAILQGPQEYIVHCLNMYLSSMCRILLQDDIDMPSLYKAMQPVTMETVKGVLDIARVFARLQSFGNVGKGEGN